MRRTALGMMASLLFAAPAQAFDDLARDLAVLPAEAMLLPLPFSYSAPKAGFADPLRLDIAFFAAGNGLGQALREPEATLALTGLDVRQITSVLTTGEPPGVVTILSGPPDMTAGMLPLLEARGFTRSEETGVAVYARGEDSAVDLSAIRPEDPFGGMLGQAQRLAFPEGRIIHTSAWGPMRQALAGLATPAACLGCLIWNTALDGIKAEAGAEAMLTEAHGFTMVAFLGGDMPLVLGADVEAPVVKPPDTPPLAPYFGGMLAMTEGKEGAASHIVLVYVNEAMARAALVAMAERLKTPFSAISRKPPPLRTAGLRSAVHASRDGMVAAVLTLPAKDGKEAARDLGLWMRMTMQRDFYVLTSQPGP